MLNSTKIMEKNSIISLCIMCLFPVIGVHNAQSATTNDSTKVVKLQKELADKDRTIENLNSVIEDLKNKNRELKSQIENELKDGKSAKYKQTIKRLRKDSTDLANQIVTIQGKHNNENNAEISRLSNLHEDDTRRIVELERELAQLNEFKGMFLTQMASGVEQKWLTKTYTEVNLAELEKEYKQYEKFADVDKKVASARDKLRNFILECRLYNRAKEAVYNEYNASNVNSLIAPMRTLRDKTQDSKNKDDLKTICRQLNNYQATVQIFQELIIAINKELNGQTQKNGAFKLVKATIDKQEREDEAITAILDIPWLAKQYEAYYDDLQKNCLAKNRIAEKILSLRTE